MTNVTRLDGADELEANPALSLVLEEVRAQMARRRMSASALARMTGTGQPYWSRRLTGVTVMDLNDLALLAYVLRVPMSTFVPAFTPDDLPPVVGKGKGPAGGAARPSLPELDSNQQPAGFEFCAEGELIEVQFGERPEVQARAAGMAVVTPILALQAS